MERGEGKIQLHKIVGMIAGVAAFSFCGDDDTTVNKTAGITPIATGELPPKCSGENTGEMIFAADSCKVYYRAGNSWKTLNGEDCAAGKNSIDTSKTDSVVVLD